MPKWRQVYCRTCRGPEIRGGRVFQEGVGKSDEETWKGTRTLHVKNHAGLRPFLKRLNVFILSTISCTCLPLGPLAYANRRAAAASPSPSAASPPPPPPPWSIECFIGWLLDSFVLLIVFPGAHNRPLPTTQRKTNPLGVDFFLFSLSCVEYVYSLLYIVSEGKLNAMISPSSNEKDERPHRYAFPANLSLAYSIRFTVHILIASSSFLLSPSPPSTPPLLSSSLPTPPFLLPSLPPSLVTHLCTYPGVQATHSASSPRPQNLLSYSPLYRSVSAVGRSGPFQ